MTVMTVRLIEDGNTRKVIDLVTMDHTSFGVERINLKFDPTCSRTTPDEVDRIKTLCAATMELFQRRIHHYRDSEGSEAVRCLLLAQDHLEAAAMFAAKGEILG